MTRYLSMEPSKRVRLHMSSLCRSTEILLTEPYFVLCLMAGRTVGHYRRLLAHVKQEDRRLTGRRWRPRLVISDFGNEFLIALQTELRRTQVRGRYFHFTQSLWRRIQAIGLALMYNNSWRLRACLRKFMAIGYLPVAVVRNNLETIKYTSLS